jgi:hypothetical protein
MDPAGRRSRPANGNVKATALGDLFLGLLRRCVADDLELYRRHPFLA